MRRSTRIETSNNKTSDSTTDQEIKSKDNSNLNPSLEGVSITSGTDIKDTMTYSSLSRPNSDEISERDEVELELLKNQNEARNSEEGRSSGEFDGSAAKIANAALQSTIPAWANTAIMLSLIFGGCCSNVFALEAIIKDEPDAGHLITFAQFLLVSLEGFIYHLDFSSPTFLKPNQIPLRRWMGPITLFFAVSILNNWAFGYNISVPVHIILRSGGSITTMIIGAFVGKKYSRLQILSVVILTVGIVISALSNAKDMGESEHSLSRFMTGLSILFVSQVLAAIMGVYIENTYQKYGSNWREGLFYMHALSLPLFVPFAQSVKIQFYRLYSSEPVPLPDLIPFLPSSLNTFQIPHQLFYLTMNVITQYVCVRGVNFLSGTSSALTVTIVLNIRKLVSLLISIWYFGNRLSGGVLFGTTVVFFAGFMYGLESQRQGRIRREAAVRSRIPEATANGTHEHSK